MTDRAKEIKTMVLVVEDDLMNQKLMSFYLRDQFSVVFAPSVKKAKEQLKQNEVELILLDLSLEGDEDGLDLVRFLRKTKTWVGIPVIAVTAHAFVTDREKCMNAGCDEFLTKPVARDTLIKVMDQYSSS